MRRNLSRFTRSLLAVAGGGSLTALIYSWKIEPRWVHIEQRSLPVVNLPRRLDGELLVQLSDLHVSRSFDGRAMVTSMQRIRDRNPAFVVYTGDFITAELEPQLEKLRALLTRAPRGRLGTAAILGNHDYGRRWHDAAVADKIVDALHNAGILVLRNRSVRYAGLRIAGIDDFWGTNYDPLVVTRQLDPDEPAVVLCHNPDVADEPVWNGYRGWILSGHTHGGHIRPPFLPPPFVPVRNRRYTAGEVPLPDGRTLYINRGLGNRIPVRFNARPEITLFTLRRLDQLPLI